MSELLLRKALACRERIRKLRSKLPNSAEAVRDDEMLEAFLSFHVFLLVQDIVDLATHLVVARGLGIPSSQREAFELLARHGLITDEIAQKMAAAAALRNRIAHGYGEIDPVRLVIEAPSGLAAVERFLDEITPTLTQV